MRRGTRVGQAYVAISADGSGINEEIVSSVGDAEDGVGESGDRAGKKYGNRFGARFSKDIEDIRTKAAHELESRLGDSGDSSGRSFTKHFGDNVDGERLGKSIGHQIASSLSDELESSVGRMVDLLEARLVDAVSRNRDVVPGSRRKDTGLTGLDDWLNRSRFRNNALNILAKSVGGITHGIEKFFQVIGNSGPFKMFTAGLSDAVGKSEMFQKLSASLSGEGGAIGGTIGKGLSAIAASGPGAAVVLIAIAAAGTLLISVLNALLAIVVALASTIASALTGALAVGAAGFAALGAAVGLSVLAFMSMTDAQKHALSTAFKPLHEEVIGLGQDMITKMVPAFAEWSKHLQVAVALAKPLADVMGGALAEGGNRLTKSLSGPGFQLFLSALTTTLPGIVTHLSSALGGFLNGLLGLFAAILPDVLTFSKYLQDVATRFERWATSAQGQNAIKDFVDRALGALHSLWSFLGAIGGLIAQVLFSPQGQNAGNNIFDSMTTAVRKFTAYLRANPGKLKEWFNEGVTFAKSLGQAIKSITKFLQQLNQSGVIDGIARLVDIGAGAYSWFSKLPRLVQGLLNPLQGMADLIGKIGRVLGLGGGGGGGGGGNWNPLGTLSSSLSSGLNSTLANNPTSNSGDINSLINSGSNALANTSSGPKQYHNPYVAYANSLIKNGPSIAAQIKNAILSVNKQIANAVREAAGSADLASLQSSLSSTIDAITTSAAETINTARSALNSAAESLASASSAKAAKHALRQVHQAQRNLEAALKNQKRIQAAAKILSAQRVTNTANVTALLDGFRVTNATLADYAAARAKLTDMLTEANQKLADAIALRDQYKTSVTDSINTFAALTTAQVQTIDGIQQALTANDITTNLQAKLTQIQTFQNNLRLLLAEGLSNDAYKQIVDAGVEQGGQYAQALIDGGTGAVQQVNSLVDQINSVAGTLGTEASDRLYQAGVAAAQGLVDGLTSLSAQLDAAAAALGNSIALAIKRALGIQSPSRVLMEMMDHVGDGAVIGLDNQHAKVGSAAARLSAQVAVSPEVASYAAAQRGGGSVVSGNQPDPRFRDLIVQTPTEDPKAVAMEVLNEVTGRL
jgi:hypothetical protein